MSSRSTAAATAARKEKEDSVSPSPVAEQRRQYPFHEIEPRWQERWEQKRAFRAPNPGDDDFDPRKPKYYVLDMFPYPSGAGLHVGHVEGYTATDIVARIKRMQGYNVLHPMGWDAFGLPAEQFAIKTGQHPSVTTQQNVDNFKAQCRLCGFSYDWEREINTTDPQYFRWTQWIFRLLYNSWFDPDKQKARPISVLKRRRRKEVPDESAQDLNAYLDSRRLAFVANAPVNWSPDLGTVLANEEVEEWQEKGFTVERRPLRQWMLRITDYAQRLLDDLDTIDWPESVKNLQRNWIGRSEGAEVHFHITGREDDPAGRVTVFTTRPDTLFGATYMVLSPEHPLVDEITTKKQRTAVDAYRKEVALKSDLERTELAKEKTGVFTGAHATNPVNGEQIPVWIADYVLMGYGTGAIMAVPAHDERDFEFAARFALPVIPVVMPNDVWLGQNQPADLTEQTPEQIRDAYLADPRLFKTAYTEHGAAINSPVLKGLMTPDAKVRMTRWLEENGVGRGSINYRLKDWLFSRQRYWGEPFPIIWRGDQHEVLPESRLPVELPAMEDFKPTGSPEGPLIKAEKWVRYSKAARRETNTMPQWAGSCWYYLRFCDPQEDCAPIGEAADRYWMDGGVDLYVGGVEHATLHLLYARFWHKVLYDYGIVHEPEPFNRLLNPGIILGEMEYVTAVDAESGEPVSFKFVDDASRVDRRNGRAVDYKKTPYEDVDKKGDHFVLKSNPDIRLQAKAFKMSKSRGNVVSPESVIDRYGADSLRLFEMFLGPLEQSAPWSMTGVEGVHRFLARVWRLFMEENQAGEWVPSPRISRDASPTREQLKVLHQTIRKVTDDAEVLGFNTAISQMMIFVNALTKDDVRPWQPVMEPFLRLLSPFAPHLAEELWHTFAAPRQQKNLLMLQPWPEVDEQYLVEDEITIVVQVNGKVRDKLQVPAATSEDRATMEKLALASETVQKFIASVSEEENARAQVRKVIVVPGKLVNIVAK